MKMQVETTSSTCWWKGTQWVAFGTFPLVAATTTLFWEAVKRLPDATQHREAARGSGHLRKLRRSPWKTRGVHVTESLLMKRNTTAIFADCISAAAWLCEGSERPKYAVFKNKALVSLRYVYKCITETYSGEKKKFLMHLWCTVLHPCICFLFFFLFW